MLTKSGVQLQHNMLLFPNDSLLLHTFWRGAGGILGGAACACAWDLAPGATALVASTYPGIVCADARISVRFVELLALPSSGSAVPAPAQTPRPLCSCSLKLPCSIIWGRTSFLPRPAPMLHWAVQCSAAWAVPMLLYSVFCILSIPLTGLLEPAATAWHWHTGTAVPVI